MLGKRNRDETVLRRRALRLRFKRIVQSVLINQRWMDDVEEQGYVMNAKRNVAFVIRPKRKLGILTVSEKALLRTSHNYRSVEERRRLCAIVASMPCFSQMPPKMRARLIPYLTFSTINEDHKLIRQNDIPIMVYFIISGEIEVQKEIYCKSTKKTMVISEAILGAGDTIGEVDLLENTIRSNTYVAHTPCEVFYIMDNEYFNILGKFMRTLWFQKKRAVKALGYFNFFTEDQLVRACQYGQLVQYDPLKSIYSEDTGVASYTYFLLSGECVILQCLQMLTQQSEDGRKNYKLVAVKKEDENVLEMPTKSVKSFYSTQLAGSDKKIVESFNAAELVSSYTDLNDEDAAQVRKAKRKLTLRDIAAACREGYVSKMLRPAKADMDGTGVKGMRGWTKWKPLSELHLDQQSLGDGSSDYGKYEDQEIEAEMSGERDGNENVVEYQLPDHDNPIGTPEDLSSHVSYESNLRITKVSLGDSECLDSSSSSQSMANESFRSLMWEGPETHFMDVGSLSFGAIFGLGETMTHRVIMARTVVQCLILPRYWLLEPEQNPGRVWLRYKYSMQTSIPSREDLFHIFLKSRYWEKFKANCVQRSLPSTKGTVTHPEDIPVMARIVETRDDI